MKDLKSIERTMHLTLEFLERMMQIAKDLKKEFEYSKATGKWYWHDRGDWNEPTKEFDTFFDALCDVCEPYWEKESEAVCEKCGAAAEYDSDICLCPKCLKESGQG